MQELTSSKPCREEFRGGPDSRRYIDWQCGAKRLLDVAGACTGLLLFSPLLLAIALLIKWEDRGPVLYRRRVVGPDGEFDAFKFRSMRVDADAILQSNPAMRREFERTYKLRSDPRATRVGRWLRKFSLDEFPQLLNVIRGEMSLVGPRMITAPELAKYGEFAEVVRTVRPGLTGYWQVNGRQRTSYEERVRMDMYYLENRSLALDIWILCKTPWKVIRGEGAY